MFKCDDLCGPFEPATSDRQLLKLNGSGPPFNEGRLWYLSIIESKALPSSALAFQMASVETVKLSKYAQNAFEGRNFEQ
jgi:hypothetical protein